MTIGSTYGNTFQAWRTGAGQAWSDYARHAFVEGLRTGELPRASFLHYLVQDYVFLVHFSRAWSLAVVKAETLEEKAAYKMDKAERNKRNIYKNLIDQRK